MSNAQKPASKYYFPASRFNDIEAIKTVARCSTKFTLNSYRYFVSQSDDNVFFSPASIVASLASLYAGARGNTSEELASCLQISDLGEGVHKILKDLFDTLQTNNPDETGYVLKTANGLFAADDLKILEEFSCTLKTFYNAEAKLMNFRSATEDSRAHINQWTEDQTENKIKELIKPGILDSRTAMVLVNAIYFKGSWMIQFKPEDTYTGSFQTFDGKIEVPMMKIVSSDIKCGIHEELDCKLVDLPYGNKELSMTLIIPDEVNGLKALEDQLTEENLAKMLKKLYFSHEVTLHLPRYKLEYEQKLNDMLAATGMPSLFSANADLSGITGSKDLKVSAVVHKAFVEVNEEGTEAAAATAAVCNYVSVQMPLEIKCDHPFIFVIREHHSDHIVFMGRVVKPVS